MRHEFRYNVRIRDTDYTGVVYHPNFLSIVEFARSDWFFGKGLVDKGNLPSFVIKEAKIDYKRPARVGDVLIVKTYVPKIGRTFIVFTHEVYNEETNVLLCTAEVLAVHVGADFKPKRLPDDIKMEMIS